MSFRAQIYTEFCRAFAPEAWAAALSGVRNIRHIVKQQGYDALELEAMVVEAALLRAVNGAQALQLANEAQALASRLSAVGALSSARHACRM
jgi:hypothetical protein